MEAAACADAAAACGAFLMAGARWNAGAGAGAALFRLSEAYAHHRHKMLHYVCLSKRAE